MRSIKRKLFLIHQHEKEEAWLNNMAAKGLALISFQGFCRYEFEDCKKGEYTYKIELLEDIPSSAEGRKYIEFMEEMGVEMVGSYLRWVYFRKKAADGPLELFSDIDSKITHYSRIRTLAITVGIAELVIAFTQLPNAHSSKLSILYFLIGLMAIVGGYLVVVALTINKKLAKLRNERNIRE